MPRKITLNGRTRVRTTACLALTSAAVLGDDLETHQGHPEGSAPDGDRVGEVDQQPQRQAMIDATGAFDNATSSPINADKTYSMTCPPMREQSDGDQHVDDEGRNSGDDAGVVALQADIAVGLDSNGHVASCPSSWSRTGGPLGRDGFSTAQDAVDPTLHEGVEADTGAAHRVDDVAGDAGTGAGNDRAQFGALAPTRRRRRVPRSR